MPSDPTTQFHNDIFHKVVGSVRGGDVLDLGCGRAGIYYALGYASNARTITFYDNWEEKLELLRAEYETLSPEQLATEYQPTLTYLRSSPAFTVPESDEELAGHLLAKIKAIKTFDFTKDTPSETFDHVLSIKSIECVANLADFDQAIRAVHGMLREGGQFSGVVLRYKDTKLKNMLQAAHQFSFSEGEVNPDAATIAAALQSAGFMAVATHIVDYPNLNPNYSEAIYFNATKPEQYHD